MKVLGKTDDGLIVQVTTQEAAHLLGQSYPGPEVRNLRPGDEIPVHEIFEILRSWRENRDKLGGFEGEWPVVAPAPEPEPPAEDDPSTHTEPRPGVWYRVLPRSGALVARFPFEALLGKRLEYRHPNGDTGVIEAYDYDLPVPCEFRVAMRAVD